MKKTIKNTTKLLIYVYGASLAGRKMVDYEYVHLLFSELSASGRRSLISSLKEKQFLFVGRHNGAKKLYITSHGQTYVEQEFPALSSGIATWDGTWAQLVFIQSPATDPQFRYLRQLLIDTNAGQLRRGVYISPGRFHKRVEEQFPYYKNAIIVTTIADWQFGDERSVIEPLFNLSDVRDSLSGVSGECDRLLVVLNNEKRSISSLEKDFCLVFDRLLAICSFDIGVHAYYFSQVPSVRNILTRLCSLQLL
jgi:DNA-binding transcriptional regulator PaaX